MRSAFFPPALARRRAWPGRRAIAFALVVAIHALLAVLLLMLTPQMQKRRDEAIKVFEMLSVSDQQSERTPAKRSKRAAAAPAPKAVKTPPPKPILPPEPKLFETQLFEGVDISKLPNRRSENTPGEMAEGTGNDSAAAYGPGEGPGGQTLYQAEWKTEPTHAQLAYYLPANAPQNSWGIIACRTVEKFRVEDCQELAESPVGSGLSGAVRQAAWQFRVLPPRINGRPVIGAWVRIRIDFSEQSREPANGRGAADR